MPNSSQRWKEKLERINENAKKEISMTFKHGFKSERKSRRIDPILLLIFFTLLLVGCGIKGRFYAKRGHLRLSLLCGFR